MLRRATPLLTLSLAAIAFQGPAEAHPSPGHDWFSIACGDSVLPSYHPDLNSGSGIGDVWPWPALSVHFESCADSPEAALAALLSTLQQVNDPFPATSPLWSSYYCAWDCDSPFICLLYERLTTPWEETEISLDYSSVTNQWCAKGELVTQTELGCLPCGESFPTDPGPTVPVF